MQTNRQYGSSHNAITADGTMMAAAAKVRAEALQYAVAVAELCLEADRERMIPEMITSGKSLEQIKAELAKVSYRRK